MIDSISPRLPATDRSGDVSQSTRVLAGGLGFAVQGWTAVRITRPDAPPDHWRIQWLPAPGSRRPVALGAAGLLKTGGYIYALGTLETAAARPVCLARWPADELGAG